MSSAAALTSVVEPTNCLTVQDASSELRPDLLITGLDAGGKDYLVDFTTYDPAADGLSPSATPSTVMSSGNDSHPVSLD